MKAVKRYELSVARHFTRGAMYNMMILVNTACMAYLEFVKEVDPEFSSQGKQHFFYFFVSIGHDSR